jgi:hypothetical protein
MKRDKYKEVNDDLAAHEAVVKRALKMTPREMLEYFSDIFGDIARRRATKKGTKK